MLLMPKFCRHNRLIQNCPICSREQAVEPRPLLSSSAPRSSLPRTETRSARHPTPSGSSRTRAASGSGGAGGLRVRRLARGADDGYGSSLVPGLRSSADARRLGEELAFAEGRLRRLAADPPGLYAEVASQNLDVEERIWLAFLIAYLCPVNGEDPFASIREVRTSWSGELPVLDGVALGPRSAHEPGRGARTLEAYRAWAARAGSQLAAISGEPTWTAERRFDRALERLSLPGLHRVARFDFLVTLGCLGVIELRPGTLKLGANDGVTVAAKRAFGIGDTLLLERRAHELADACGLQLAALDLGLDNWERGDRATLGLGSAGEADGEALSAVLAALSL
jgi:hypothetical protein